MRAFVLAALRASYSALSPDYSLDPGASVKNGTTKGGGAGRSTSSQSGRVRLPQSGSAKLATTSISVAPQDRYRISVKVLEGNRVVAEEEVRYPN
jgi:hypothetical protein